MKTRKRSQFNIKSFQSYKNCENNGMNNFYDICIKAIKLTNDKIVDNKDCINKVKELKDEKLGLYLKKKKINLGSNLEKNDEQLYAYKKSIEQLLKEAKEKLDKIKEKNKKNEIEKELILNKTMKEQEKKPKQFKKFFKGKEKRYTIFKHIKEYLESNDITLNELIEHNPFQSIPFNISGSYEFLLKVKYNDYKNVNLSLSKNINFLFAIDYYGQTAYHWAAKLNDIDMLDLLISYGRHHNQKDFKGRTPLYLAAEKGYIKTCKFLVENGANPFLYANDHKLPCDIARNEDVKIFLKEHMSTPFSNPIYKARLMKLLEIREDKITKKNHNKLDKDKGDDDKINIKNL